MACYKGHVKLVKFLLEKGANPSLRDAVKKSTCLHVCAERGFKDIAELLLAKDGSLLTA